MTKLNLMCEAVKYQKTVTDNTFEILSLLQNSSNEALQQSLEQCSWLPEETRKDYNQWVSYSRSASDDLKKRIDGCYQELEQQCFFWGEESVSPTEEIIAEVALIKPEVAVSRKVSAVKTKVTDRPTGGSKAKPGPTTKAENRKASPAAAVRSGRKKPVTKTQSAKKKAAVKEENSLTDSSPKVVAVEVSREVAVASQVVKEVVPATKKLPVDRNVNPATPLNVEKKGPLKSS